MYALPTVRPSRSPRKNKDGTEYVPAFPRAAALGLARRAAGARTIQEACAILRAEALSRKGKLPFATFSALPAVTRPGAGECLDWCYSFAGRGTRGRA